MVCVGGWVLVDGGWLLVVVVGLCDGWWGGVGGGGGGGWVWVVWFGSRWWSWVVVLVLCSHVDPQEY